MIFVIYNLTFYNIIFYNVNLRTYLCKSYFDDLTTVPYIGNDSMACLLFCTAALSDDRGVRPATCRNFCKLKHNSVCILLV